MPWTEAFLNAQQSALTERRDGDATQRLLTYIEALNEALALAMDLDPNVIVLGQGINDPAPMFGVTKDLQQQFGAVRVFDTPLSEEGLTGICTGAAMHGLRPVYCHNRPDFLLLAFNQIVSHASKVHYMDNGQTKVPMVIWSAIGRGWGSGAQHSQAIQGLLLSVPGLKIIMPSTPEDAKGLMLAAIADNNPVLIFEHRWLMKQQAHVPTGIYRTPIGKGVYRQRGEQLSIIGSSHALVLAQQALEAINDSADKEAVETKTITADIIDLRTIKPLDRDIILESVQKTGRVLLVDTGWAMGGVCAEIACIIAETCPQVLKAPIKRVALPDSPTPAGYTLEQLYYPSVQTMQEAIEALVAHS